MNLIRKNVHFKKTYLTYMFKTILANFYYFVKSSGVEIY